MLANVGVGSANANGIRLQNFGVLWRGPYLSCSRGGFLYQQSPRMKFSILSGLLLVPLAVLATPSPVVDPRAPSRVVEARAVVTPPPCKAISPPPTEAETKLRHDAFASAFLVRKNLTEAFSYISSTYIVRTSSLFFVTNLNLGMLQNHNPYASGNGPGPALDALGPFWGSVSITVLRTAFKGNQGWLNYRTNYFGEVVDRYRWEAGCIVEHVSDLEFQWVLCSRRFAVGSRGEIPDEPLSATMLSNGLAKKPVYHHGMYSV